MKKCRILYVASEFAPGMMPFAANIVNIANEQDIFEVYAFFVNSKEKHYNSLVSLDEDKCYFYEYPSSKFKKIIFKVYPYDMIKCIRKIVKEKAIDKVHFLTGDFSLALMDLSSYISNDNLYYTVHDLHPHTSNTMSCVGKILHRHVIKATKHLIDKIPNLTTCSIVQLNELRMRFPEKNVSYSHFPSLLTQEIKNGDRQVPELQNINDYVLFFGTVDHYKGVDDLILAFENSKLKNKCKLVIAGKGNINMKYSSDIIFLNRFILDNEIKDLFEKARLVVYPYRNMTMSGVLSLAFYFQKRIICSNLSFFKQYDNNSISFFEQGNIRELAECLNKQYDKTPEKIRVYEEYFSDNELLHSLLNFYKLI